MANPEIVTAPLVEPVSTADAKTHLRVDHADDDAYIADLISAARVYAEGVLGRAMITTVYDYFLDRFPPVIVLPRNPVQSIGSITYVDDDGVVQTLEAATYVLKKQREPARVVEAFDESWPSTRNVEEAVTVRFTAGYGDAASDVPASIVHAVKLLVGHWYEIREPAIVGSIVTDVPIAVDALLHQYALVEFF